MTEHLLGMDIADFVLDKRHIRERIGDDPAMLAAFQAREQEAEALGTDLGVFVQELPALNLRAGDDVVFDTLSELADLKEEITPHHNVAVNRLAAMAVSEPEHSDIAALFTIAASTCFSRLQGRQISGLLYLLQRLCRDHPDADLVARVREVIANATQRTYYLDPDLVACFLDASDE